jgi:hypothetical protein
VPREVVGRSREAFNVDGGLEVSACRGKFAQHDLGSGQNLVGQAKGHARVGFQHTRERRVGERVRKLGIPARKLRQSHEAAGETVRDRGIDLVARTREQLAGLVEPSPVHRFPTQAEPVQCEPCRCRKPHPCWSGGMVVLVEDAVESITSSDDEVIQSA